MHSRKCVNFGIIIFSLLEYTKRILYINTDQLQLRKKKNNENWTFLFRMHRCLIFSQFEHYTAHFFFHKKNCVQENVRATTEWNKTIQVADETYIERLHKTCLGLKWYMCLVGNKCWTHERVRKYLFNCNWFELDAKYTCCGSRSSVFVIMGAQFSLYVDFPATLSLSLSLSSLQNEPMLSLVSCSIYIHMSIASFYFFD